MTQQFETYQHKVMGCFLGKSVGGTLGGPYEGDDGPLSLTYYDPVPDQMLPNDDLDLQVVWLEQLLRTGLPINARQLAEGWLNNIELFPDEYGIARRNLERKLYPPFSGHFDNPFVAGMGAAIRTELWACLAPGNPELAVHLAQQDAVVDHSGEGMYAAMFLAALESLAFIETDRQTLITQSLTFIPNDCRVALAIQDTVEWCTQENDWRIIRKNILEKHGSQNFTDVAQNLAIIVLGFLISDDFGESLCTAVNCGCDTDCTGATLGALLGILAPDSIDQKWLQPIGLDVVLSPGMVGMHPASDLEIMCQQITDLMPQVLRQYDTPIPFEQKFTIENNTRLQYEDTIDPHTAVIALKPLQVIVNYPAATVFFPDQEEIVEVTLVNPYSTPVEGSIGISVPNGWTISEGEQRFSLEAYGQQTFSLSIAAPQATALRCYQNLLCFDFSVNGLQWSVEAGLPQSTPWKIQPIDESVNDPLEITLDERAQIDEGVGGTIQVGPERCLIVNQMKIPTKDIYTLVVQGDRPCAVFVDGEKLYDYAGDYFVPAMHRNRTAKPKEINRGWHELQILVPEGPAGELFVSIGNGKTWKLQTAVEWKLA